jgi:hypothetical protein
MLRESASACGRTGDGPTSNGKLELDDDKLVLRGSAEPDGLRI